MAKQQPAHTTRSKRGREPATEAARLAQVLVRERTPSLISQSASIVHIRAQLEEIARTYLTVLITGEIGTGSAPPSIAVWFTGEGTGRHAGTTVLPAPPAVRGRLDHNAIWSRLSRLICQVGSAIRQFQRIRREEGR